MLSPEESSSNEDQYTLLTPVDFPIPRCRYESEASYTNAQGQTFRLIASGMDKEEVEAYIRDIRVDIQVLPYEELHPIESTEVDEIEGSKYDDLQAVDLRFEMVEAPGLEPPYLVMFVIDPKINETSNCPHTHTYFAKAIQIRVSASDHVGKTASLKKQGSIIIPPRNLLANLSGNAGSVVKYQVVIQGSGKYTISGKYTN